VGPLPAFAKALAGEKLMETFKGHKFWVGVVVGAVFMRWGLPYLMAITGRSGGS
jgi:hypothetical protein